jgi:hypothetical protein
LFCDREPRFLAVRALFGDRWIDVGFSHRKRWHDAREAQDGGFAI